MHALLGYLVCLVVLTPAFSVDVFFALIGATSRQHDLLEIVRAVSRMLLNVTSPVKIALFIAVLFGVFASDFARPTRGVGLLIASVLSIVGTLHLVTGHQFTGLAPMIAVITGGFATFLSFYWGSRLITASSC